MGGLTDRIRYALVNPLRDDHAIDPMRELAALLREVDLEPEAGGGAVTFTAHDPIISSPLPFATMAAVALMAKAVSVAARWRARGGQGQDLSVNLGKALHRLCPFYDKKLELLNGYAPGNPPAPKNPFMPFATRLRSLHPAEHPSVPQPRRQSLGQHRRRSNFSAFQFSKTDQGRPRNRIQQRSRPARTSASPVCF